MSIRVGLSIHGSPFENRHLVRSCTKKLEFNRTVIEWNIIQTSLDSAAKTLLDILPRQKWVGKLTFILSALNLKISFQLASK